MENFTPISAIAGGGLIGLSAALLLAINGRLAGISGILAGLLRPTGNDWSWRLFFIVGLIGGSGIWLAAIDRPVIAFDVGWPVVILGGILTGVGTRIGAGCTSGHGVCGLARLSPRSLVATLTFVGTGALTVFVVRHVVGG
ncbi:MAG: YeeE/YedE thiosulfate transporter family protein [Alphaproteobacteria bacterium]